MKFNNTSINFDLFPPLIEPFEKAMNDKQISQTELINIAIAQYLQDYGYIELVNEAYSQKMGLFTQTPDQDNSIIRNVTDKGEGNEPTEN